VLLLLKLKELMLLLILNVLVILWLTRSTAGHASVLKLRRKDGILLDVDHDLKSLENLLFSYL
jgi:hypothetical protein